MPKTPIIAVDAMGGDFGPGTVVPAAVDAVRAGKQVILVGDEGRIRTELANARADGLAIPIVHASQVVEMDDKPAEALRQKKDSSIQVCCRLVREGKADGVVSAGNSGASVACGMFVIGRIRGVERPALASVVPSEKGPVVLLDVGANVDSRPHHLFQFGLMGSVFAGDVLHKTSPKVGLLSIGEEEGKGNSTVKEAFELLRRSSINYIGNVEGRDIFTGNVDVVVCDGFVGNVALKLSEGLAKSLGNVLKGELKRDLLSKIGAMLSMRAFSRFARFVDYAEYGGAPLLGLKNIVIVCHGASNCKAVTNAIRMAATFVENRANEDLVEALENNGDLVANGRRAK